MKHELPVSTSETCVMSGRLFHDYGQADSPMWSAQSKSSPLIAFSLNFIEQPLFFSKEIETIQFATRQKVSK